MNPAIDSDAFRDELGGWALRGIGCAAVSAFWAAMMGFQQAPEIAGMIFGVAVWVTIFAAFCLWGTVPAWFDRTRTMKALRTAAWIKFLLTITGGLAMLVAHYAPFPIVIFALFGMLDAFLGLGALWVTSRIAGVPSVEHVPKLDSFGWTALTTVVEGAMMAIVIAALALLVLGWWKLRSSESLRRFFLQARVAG